MNIEKITHTTQILPLARKTIVNLLYTEKWLSEQMNAVLKPYDVSIPQFNVLRILKGQQGKPANLSTIQTRMVSKMSNTTRLVDKLIEKGYVNRITCTSNRRKVEITITKTGNKFINKVSKAVTILENDITDSITTQELTLLNELLEKLRTKNIP